MCGLFGYMTLDRPISEDELRTCTRSLDHRGPDFSDHYLSENGQVGFGHTRLSVLDTSASANQPMYAEHQKVVLIYNGEVYNFMEIRAELEQAGVRFESSGDTEVILRAFQQWGAGFVSKLNGMFSIAIYQKDDGSCWLFRDRVGIKPLYLYKSGKTLAFASELKAILKLDNLNCEVCDEAIYMFLHLGYIPAPLTIWTNIAKVKPGYYVHIDANLNTSEHQYWNPGDMLGEEKIRDIYAAKEALRELLFTSVEMRLVSDVPIGTFLSGGIDSSLVTALAAAKSSGPVRTFSIGFDDPKHDESIFARDISSHLGTDHTEFKVDEEDVLTLIPEMDAWFDEPFADSSALPTHIVSKLARENVTVALTGDGGDELFLGYGSYEWSKRLARPWIYPFRFPIAYLLSHLGGNRMKRAASVFRIQNAESRYSHIFSQEQYLFSEFELRSLIHNPTPYRLSRPEEVRLLRDPMEQQAFMDLLYYLPDDLLTKVDRTSMAVGLECRVPLLDHHVVAFCHQLDRSCRYHKVHGAKYLLRKILEEFVPRSLFDRPKRGFSIPLDRWLQGPLSHLVDDLQGSTKIYAYVRKEEVDALIARFRGGAHFLYNRIWALCVLGRWLEDHT